MNRFIIDGFNLLYRSHYAFQKFSTSTGLPSGGVYGFFSILKSLKNKYSDFKFYVVWDNEAKKKKELLNQYKANREPYRVRLPVADIKEALKYLSIIQVECPNEEADDVIASLVSQSNDGKDYIYSSDKDLLQLVKDGRVIVVSPKVGTVPEKFYDEEAVKIKWGVKPEDLACLFAFKGDTSDNIPGTSVPSKILAFLSTKYKKPGAIYESLGMEKLTDFQRQSLEKNKNQVFINHIVIELKKDLSCVFVEGLSSPDKLREIFDKYEIKAISVESLVELFSVQNTFLCRTGPSLKTISLFEEQ
jgi:DNA polymerase-1